MRPLPLIRSLVANKALLVGFTMLALLVLSPGTATGKDKDKKRDSDTRFQYAAPFVCGFDPAPAFVRVIPGQYATAVAIHNPAQRAVTFRKRLALTFPPAEQTPGIVSEFKRDTLETGQALQVSCTQIPVEFFPGMMFPPYVQGFVIIESERSLDVTSTISAGPTDAPPAGSPPSTLARVQSITVVQVRERRLDRDED